MYVFFIFLHLIFSIQADVAREDNLWKEFKQNYSKTYKSFIEESYRLSIFNSNLRLIEDHNDNYATGNESYFLGINQFVDLTDEEFDKIYLNYKADEDMLYEPVNFPLNLSLPGSLDWRQKGAVQPIRNQGGCGSCWAFSAIAAVEGQNAIKHKRAIALSEQELVDCSRSYNNHGCQGGLMDPAFKYIKAKGISTRSSYPYKAANGRCQKKTRAVVKVTGFRDISRSEGALQQAVASIGPISVAINANLLKFYKGGIFDNKNCAKTLNHAVVVVGYGAVNKHAYWIVKNSWGTSFGEHGYIRMTRNKNNQCGIASKASYPIIA